MRGREGLDPMSDSIRFYSTKVTPEASLAEVATLLRKYGAQRFEQVWEAGRTRAIRFNLPVPEAEFGFMSVLLEPKIDTLRTKLFERHKIDDEEQVERVAWRQLKGILEGILLAIDTGMFSAPELFLGMAETKTGSTLWEAFLTEPELLLIGPGG